MFIDELVVGKHLIVSYYYSVNLRLTLTLAKLLKDRGEEVCILNEHKIKWNLAPFTVEFNCSESSVNLVFEAESELEVPKNYLFVTSSRKLNLPGAKTFHIKKISEVAFLAYSEEARFSFKIGKDTIEEFEQGEDLIKILKDLGGEATLRDLVNISSKKLNLPKEKVREEVSFLINTGKISVAKNFIRLNSPD